MLGCQVRKFSGGNRWRILQVHCRVDPHFIYRLNLRDANSFFLARSFPMQDKDILYVSNSASDPVQKFLGLFGSVMAPATLGASVYGAVK